MSKIEYECPICGTVIKPYTEYETYDWCLTCNDAVYLTVDGHLPAGTEVDSGIHRTDEEDESVMNFFEAILNGLLLITWIGTVIGFFMTMYETGHNGNVLAGFGVIIGMWANYFIWKLFILTAKGLYRNISIIRKNI